MNQTISLFNELKSGGYDACLMTTFSIDFPFYEDVLLRRMQSSGINHHVLLVDKGMGLAAMHERPPCKVGSHYVLAPMDCPGAFHPKLLMLLGKNKGLLAIGSHNATLSGFGQNLEITNVLRFTKGSNEEYLSIFQQAYQAFHEWLESYGGELPGAVKESLDRTVHLSPWLNATVPVNNDQYCQLLFTSKSTDSLWQQLQPLLPANIHQITGISAFFDTQLAFLRELIALSDEAPVIAVQPETVSAPVSLLDQADICLVDVNSVKDIQQDKRYVHAKLIHLLGDESVFVSGSANFSRPAWLSDSETRNAEAVLVIKGEEAQTIAEDLFLFQLKSASVVNEIVLHTMVQSDPDCISVGLMLVDDVGDESVVIPIEEVWPDSHRLAYVDSFGSNCIIDAMKNDKHWIMPRSELHEGELISVISGKSVVARIVVLNIPQLRSNSSAGKERALQQALGSLNSDTPDIDLLFRCIGKMIPSEKEEKKSSTIRSSSKVVAVSETPDTLLENLDSVTERKAGSGRMRCSGGDIGLLLDMFIYNLGNSSRIDSAKAYGEDALGRSEEDLIDSEDGEDAFEEDNILKADDDEDARIKADKTCQRKLETILRRAESFVKAMGMTSDENLKGTTPVILGVLVLTHELYRSQKQRKWVIAEYLNSLAEFLFLRIFSEKHPVVLDAEELGGSSIFLSDEWAQLVGYSAWLAYHTDMVLKSRLPISASIEVKDSLRWKNACWLFLAQRTGNDNVANGIASKLLAQEGEQAESWLNMLVAAGTEVVTNKRLPIQTGFCLASSSKGAYEGYKLVTEIEDEFVGLASINTKQNSNKFKVGFLDVIGV
jgi:hypothetical protein